MVLDGHWHDEYGSFGKYTYIRNYIGSGRLPPAAAAGQRQIGRTAVRMRGGAR